MSDEQGSYPSSPEKPVAASGQADGRDSGGGRAGLMAATSGGIQYATAVRLRGLPFSASEQDVLAFFAQHDIVDRIADGPHAVNLLLRSNGRPSGQAVVQMKERADTETAQHVLGGQWMGSRYIEVFSYNEDGYSDGAAGVAAVGASNDGGAAALAALQSPLPGATPEEQQQAMAAALAFQAAALSSPWLNSPWGPPPAGLGQSVPNDAASWQALYEFLGPEAQANMAAIAAATNGQCGFDDQAAVMPGVGSVPAYGLGGEGV
jgi:hypothetical protein